MPEGSTRFLSTITSSASKQFAGAMLFSYGGNILTGNHNAEALAGAAVSSLMTVYAPALMWGCSCSIRNSSWSSNNESTKKQICRLHYCPSKELWWRLLGHSASLHNEATSSTT